MASELDICNLALGHCGDEGTVSSIDPPEGSAQAEHCARFYPIARDSLLEQHDWSFALRRTDQLATPSVTPPAGWLYAFNLPSDMLAPVRLIDSTDTDDTRSQPYVIETAGATKVLYTNVELPVLIYKVRVTNAAKFPPAVVVALARLLASFLAGPIYKGTEGMKVAQAQLKWYTELDLPAAMSADARVDEPPRPDDTPSSILARK